MEGGDKEMARKNESRRSSTDQKQGLRDENGQFTEKGAEKYGREGGQASSRNRNSDSRGKSGSSRQNQGNKSSNRNH